MSSTKFIALLPQKVQPGDKIRLKGKTIANAEEFSINFANEPCANPLNITYHFKWLLYENVIVENYKDNGSWMDHREIEYNRIDGPTFGLEFAFQEDGIYVYLLEDGGHNIITHYEPLFELSDIRSVQVWGDVEKVTDLAFAYK